MNPSVIVRQSLSINLHSAIDLSQITIGHHLRGLIADANFETRRAPVDELDSPLSLQGGNSTVDIFRNNIATVEQAGCHVFAVTRIAFDHLVVGLEAGH